ncbi:hypothetical protein PYW08_008046 [Mythimna loreyi]|uniref:Uncharacterized protein n=1 Tax=Mythimna loreyi TaxID=667449 RepID=A0ACC2QAR7_9NEOP|nr:hypothetical protein PYW08_008046 [Mythimna loreyi]
MKRNLSTKVVANVGNVVAAADGGNKSCGECRAQNAAVAASRISSAQRYAVTSSIDEPTETCPIRRRRRARARERARRLVSPARRINQISGAERARGVAAADTSPRPKNNAAPRSPARAGSGGARGNTRDWAARAGGVSRAAPPAASRLTPAARAGVATGRASVARAAGRRVMDVA